MQHTVKHLGDIQKGCPHPRGVSQKQKHADTGGGGLVEKSGRPQIQIFTNILEV